MREMEGLAGGSAVVVVESVILSVRVHRDEFTRGAVNLAAIQLLPNPTGPMLAPAMPVFGIAAIRIGGQDGD